MTKPLSLEDLIKQRYGLNKKIISTKKKKIKKKVKKKIKKKVKKKKLTLQQKIRKKAPRITSILDRTAHGMWG